MKINAVVVLALLSVGLLGACSGKPEMTRQTTTTTTVAPMPQPDTVIQKQTTTTHERSE